RLSCGATRDVIVEQLARRGWFEAHPFEDRRDIPIAAAKVFQPLSRFAARPANVKPELDFVGSVETTRARPKRSGTPSALQLSPAMTAFSSFSRSIVKRGP